MTAKIRLTPLTDPSAQQFELVPDDELTGFTHDEAIAFLVGVDTNTFGVPQIIVADYDPHQLRSDRTGRWIKSAGGSDVGDVSDILKKLKKAKDGRGALKSAGSVADHTKKEPLRGAAAIYYQDESDRINRPLRTGDALPHRSQVTAQTLDRMMSESKLSSDVRVFRSMARPTQVFGGAWRQSGSNVGLTWRDDGFVSTTTDEKIAEVLVRGRNSPTTTMVMMEILAPQGTPALHMDIGKYADEKEILFGRGNTYRIVRDDGVKNGLHRIVVEVMPGSPVLTAAGNETLDDVRLDIATDVNNDDDAKYARLVDNGPEVHVIADVEITVATANTHDGAMIALLPSEDDARRLAVAGGEPRDQLHVTLVYLGDADDIAVSARQRLIARVHAALAGRGDVVGEGFAINVFNPPGHVKEDGKERDSCIVLGLSGRELAQTHDTITLLTKEVESVSPGLLLPEQHVPWIPHMTLVYTDDVARVTQLMDRVGPVHFDRVRLAFGGENVDIPLAPMTAAVQHEFHLPYQHNQQDHNPHKGFRVTPKADLKKRVDALDTALGTHYKSLATDKTQRDKYGVWKPERDKIHREIVDALYKKAGNVPNDGHAILLGGSAGAGKSTVINQMGIDAGKFMVIAPDDIKEELARRGLVPDIPGHDYAPMERSTLVHQESIRIGDMLADRAFRDRKNVIWDGTMGNSGLVINRVKRMNKAGYDRIDALFVDVSDATSRRRAAERYRQGQRDWAQGNGLGGRYVPKIIQNAVSSGEVRYNFNKLRKMRMFDNWSFYSNDVDGQPAKLLGKAGDM